jgi:D-3-phosphoglycerate dehydrogenase / 2-oxoglutarate reductase
VLQQIRVMKKVLIATEKPFVSTAVNKIRKIFKKADEEYELTPLEGYSSRNDLLEAVSDIDALIVRSDIIDRDVINASGHLKILVRAGSGYDNIDLDAATQKDIVNRN